MEDIKFVTIETEGVSTEHIIIDKGNGEFTSMPKSVWDEQQAQLEEGK